MPGITLVRGASCTANVQLLMAIDFAYCAPEKFLAADQFMCEANSSIFLKSTFLLAVHD
jgi:hypothetical protein